MDQYNSSLFILTNKLNDLTKGLGKTKINYSRPLNTLNIYFSNFFPATIAGKILWALYQEFSYSWHYIKYSIKTTFKDNYETKNVKEYLQLIFTSPFLWEKNNNLFFLSQYQDNLENFYYREENRTIYFCKSNNEAEIKKQNRGSSELKRILESLGLPLIKLSSEDIGKNRLAKKGFFANSKIKKINLFGLNYKKDLLLKKNEENQIYELGVHTRFSTLDGISSPKGYIAEAQKKNYGAIAVTDLHNVQAFAEFWENRTDKLKVIYGCELEMLEDELPPFLFNIHQKDISDQKIEGLTYCVFDLETTSLYSEYNEIIELGYVIYKKGQIISEANYLIQPEKKKDFYEKKIKIVGVIDPNELKSAFKINEVLEKIKKEWKDCVLVAHNAKNFDFGFLNKAWIKNFDQELPFPIIDTLALSWIVFPKKKRYNLESLTSLKKNSQEHRALSDSKLLTQLLEKIIKELKNKGVEKWKEVNNLISERELPKWGSRIKVLVQNQQGLYNLYRLITISHTKHLLKNPCVLRSDLVKLRSGLLIGSSGSRDGEIFDLFGYFNTHETRIKALKFYDFVEIRSLRSFSYLWHNGCLEINDLKRMTQEIIFSAEELKKPIIASNNVHYCVEREKILKDIIVANKGLSGARHYLYKEATLYDREDNFLSLPFQHLLTKSEMIENWTESLDDIELIEKILFENPKKLIKSISDVEIKPATLEYPTIDLKEKEKELKIKLYQKATELFGPSLPKFVNDRINLEWNNIGKKYVFIYWLAYKVCQKAHQDNYLVGSRGSVGSSFIAYLCGITELNPLPFYKFCYQCKYTEVYQTKEANFSCYDYKNNDPCPNCANILTMEGHNLAAETFFGLKGEKFPDIDLNVSAGLYQKRIHNYMRELLGEKSVHRIGTINTLKGAMSEMFWDKYIRLRKKLNSEKNINEITNSIEMTEWEKKYWADRLQKKMEFREQDLYRAWSENENLDNEDQKKIKREIINGLQGIKRTTGQHPGGMFITPPGIEIAHYTPLNYPANRISDFTTTHLEYEHLSSILIKLDILGHVAPTFEQKLIFLTNKDFSNISFSDDRIMNLFATADTLGITEFGTDLVRKILLSLKPSKFSHLLLISGFSHGENIWFNNQQNIFKKKLLELDELMACRDDIWSLLQEWGVDKYESFIATEFIRKGKWNVLNQEIKENIKEKFNTEKGKIYIEILNKIVYIFPKAHAISYTISAWREAYYKVYYPEIFYSTLLTYHTTVHDIWLMTLNPDAIKFRLERLIDDLDTYKNSSKELISIIKVLKEMDKKSEENSNWKKMDVQKILNKVYEKIKERDESLLKKIETIAYGFNLWSSKEKDLLFTLKIINEMDNKQLNFRIGIDLNNSESTEFKIEKNTIFFPLYSITGFGESVVAKIINFRKNKEKISRDNWKEVLEEILNINHIKQIINLDEYGILIWN